MILDKFIAGTNRSQLVKTLTMCHNNNWIPILDYAKEGSKNVTDVLIYMTRLKEISGLSPTYALKLSSFEPFDPCNNMDYMIDLLKNNGATKIFLDAETVSKEHIENNIFNKLILKHNKEEAFLYKTYQMYKKNNTLFEDLEKLPNLGVKLVRGAYYEQDYNTGKLFTNINDTHKNYDDTLEKLIEYKQDIPIVVATHNKETIKRFESNKNLEFAQLLGIRDNYSKELSNNHKVYKYLPYGSMSDIIPYLSRRLYENKSILKNIIT
jgi:proline dehydrogenase